MIHLSVSFKMSEKMFQNMITQRIPRCDPAITIGNLSVSILTKLNINKLIECIFI